MSEAEERLFFCVEGTSRKFWGVRVVGAEQIVRYGRIGTVGQTATKIFDAADAARAATEKLIAQKTAKGYYSVTPERAKLGQLDLFDLSAEEAEPCAIG